MTTLVLNQTLFDDPFRVLFYKALEEFEIHTVGDRVEFLDRLAEGLHHTENSIKNAAETQTWMGIASVFSAAITISGFVLIPPPFNAVLAIAATGSAITGVSESVTRRFKLSPVADELERHAVAIRSTEVLNWAALWEYCHKTHAEGDELFRNLLFKASRGTVHNTRIVRTDNTKEPFIAAIKAIASRQGRKVEDVSTLVRAIKETFLNQQIKPTNSGWVPMPEPPADPPKIAPVNGVGVNTQLGHNVVNVPAVNVSIADAPIVDNAVQPKPNSNSVNLESHAASQPVRAKVAATPQDLDRIFNLPAAEHEENTAAASTTAVQAAFPRWKPKSIEVAATIADWLASRPAKSFTPATIRNSIETLKNNENFTNDRVKAALDALVEAKLLTEAAGRYAIVSSSNDIDDYDF